MDIQAVLSLLTLASQEARLIEDLNNYFNFDYNIFLVESSVDISRFVSNGDQPRSVFTFDRVNGRVTGTESAQKIKSKNPFMVLVPESDSFVKDENLLVQIRKIQHSRKPENRNFLSNYHHVHEMDMGLLSGGSEVCWL